ncbi:MAG: alginate lyase family protein [Acidobacteria bacterium]|nr:alginate lyase family protein [Acidobacteriota bacterium]
MQVRVEQIKKLRGRSWREIGARGKQEITKLNERLLGHGTAEMSDAELLREINPFNLHNGGEGIGALILERIRTSLSPELGEGNLPVLLPSLLYREEIASLMFHSFPAAYRAILKSANQAIEGRFNLLGFTDLSFGEPIDWHLEPLSGKRTGLEHWSQIDYLKAEIVGDKKVTWELNRHAHFVTLGQAYWLTGDERFAETFVAHASSWMNANPPNRGINWASSLELALRAIHWIWALHLFADSRHLSSKFVTRLLKYLVAHGRHIESYLSYYFSPNTHLTGEALGLFYLGTALPELSRARLWQQTGRQILLEQLPIHLRRDGVYFEQTTYYHRYTVDFYIHLLALAKAANFALPPVVEERLTLAFDYLMWITRPDGTAPLIGDDDGGRLLKLSARAPDDFRDTLANGAAWFERGDWKFVAGEASAETLWLLGPEGFDRYNRIEAQLPVATHRAFSDSGFYAMRDGWWRDSTYALMDCGPHGVYTCGHAHADALAFEFAAMGTTWLVDPGTFTYTADDQARNAFRDSAAHNTATVDGQSQSQPAGAFSWHRVATAKTEAFIKHSSFAYFEGSHDGYRQLSDPVMHTRTLLFLQTENTGALPTYLVLRDQFAAQGAHDYALYFHLPAEATAVASDHQIRAAHPNGQRLMIQAFSKQVACARVEQGLVSQVYGQRQSAAVGVINFQGESEQEVMSFILPFSAKHQGARVEQQPTGDSQAGAFTVSLGQARDVVIAGDGVKPVACEQLSAVASMAWARFVDHRLVRACFVKGKELKVAGNFVLRSSQLISHCVIQVNAGELDIAIEGASNFTIKANAPVQKITVGGKAFRLPAGQQSVAFINDAGEWRLTQTEL